LLRKDFVKRRAACGLRKATKFEHILLGFKIALEHLDGVIETINTRENAGTARNALVAKFSFSERQAQAILAMRLSSLIWLNRQEIDEEHAETINAIARLKSILNDESKLMGA
jgi:DNA gyrase subunit A